MLESEKREILDALEAGREALREALAGVDEPLAMLTPRQGGWSILECVEHVAAVEQFLLSRLRTASCSEHSHEDRRREALITRGAADRTRPREAPEEVRPGGRFGSVREALLAFDSERAGTVRFVEEFSGDPRFWVTSHPIIPGPVNCYEMLLIIALHPARHAKQIAEIRASLAPLSGMLPSE